MRYLIALVAMFVAMPVSAEGFGPVPSIEVKAARAELGKRLFFDRRLSGDAAISCASCHKPEAGFSDGIPLSAGYPGSSHFRNTPTLINTAHRDAWFHDGRLGTNLNDVTREMITETYLMNMDMRLMQERLKQDPVYVAMFQAAGFGEPSNGGARKAIPEYLKTLISRGAPFDAGAMSASAMRGFELFKGSAGCARCHSGPRFTDDRLHNTGVPENPDVWNEPLRHMTYVAFAKFQGIANYMNLRRDVGGHIRTNYSDQRDVGSFMTPGLRELTSTAPYMHNGTLATIEDVVEFYDKGAGNDPNKDSKMRPLGLSDAEKTDLVGFLTALSGEPLTGPEHVWQEPYPATYPVIENWQNVSN